MSITRSDVIGGLGLVALTILAMTGKIAGEAVVTYVGGLAITSPLTNRLP